MHGFNATNSFVELAAYYGITIFEINRDAEPGLLQNILETEDFIFMITLTGWWMEERFPLLKITPEIADKIILISYVDAEKYRNVCGEIVSVKKLDEFFSGNYFSSHTLQMFFLLVVTYLSALKN